MKKILLLLATIVTAISCNNNEMDSTQQGGVSDKALTLNVSTGAPISKVDIADNGDSWQVTWNAKDQLAGWSKDSDYKYSSKFTIDNIDATGKNAEFTGNLIYNASTMRLSSPYMYDLSKIDNKIELSLETQNVSKDFSHLGATTYMLSNEFDIESVSSATPSTQTAISMRHIGAAIELAIKFEEPTTEKLSLTSIVLGGGDGIDLPTTGEINIEDGSFATTATGEIKLDVANVEAVDGIYTIRFSTFPFSVASGKSIDLAATFVDSNNASYSAEASIVNSGENFEVARATKNYLYAKLSEATKNEAQVEKTLTLDGALGFPTASSSTISTININGIEFTVCNAWYNEYYGSYTITKLTNGYFYNTTPLTNLSKIVVTEDFKYYNFTVYAGKKAGDKATKLSYDNSGTEYTYSIPTGYDFVTFVNEETEHNATCDKIVFTYGKSGSTGGGSEGGDGSTEQEDAISYDFHFTSLTEQDDIVSGDATYTDEKIDFVVNNAYYASSYDNTTIEEGGYIYNTTALNKGLIELVINYQTSVEKYQTAEVYVGTTANPTTEISPESTNENVVTYTIPETTTYFKITSPKGYIRINSIELNTESSSAGGDSGSGDDGYTPSIPTGDGETRHAGWAELPIEDSSMEGDYYYAYHMRADKSSVRNFTVCYSKKKMCPVWVASPMHSSYKGSASRTNAYGDDPKIPFTEKGRWDGYTRGHMLGSSDRLVSTATNKQVFYHSNIAPQLSSGFNTGGGVWNNLESLTDGQWCSDTLYLVNGSYWANENKKVDGTVIPTHYYKVMLRTKSGNTGKAVWDCSSDELKCVAFIIEHNSKQHMVKPHTGMLRSVAEIEKMTGHKFFTNVPNAPKESYKASDWGL